MARGTTLDSDGSEDEENPWKCFALYKGSEKWLVAAL